MTNEEEQSFTDSWNEADPSNQIVIPQQGILYIEEELDEPEPRYLKGLAKLMERKSPWKDEE